MWQYTDYPTFRNSVSAEQYHLTVSRAQVSTHWARVFWSYPLTSCYFSNDRRLKFNVFKMHMKWVVFMSRTFKIFDFELTSDVKIQPAFICREGNRFWLFSLSCVDHALSPLFVFWLVKIWQVSSRRKFLQRLETCLLIAEADRVLCRLVMF